jgi:ribonuclease HIII
VGALTSYTAKLTPDQAAALEKIIRDGSYELREVPYARFSGVRPEHNVTYYESGKLVVQGRGTREFVEFVLEPQVLGAAKLGYETVLNPELLDPRIGVDESGKGDFFGPLCVAAVYVNESVVRAWKDAGIQDSKNIGSDKRIAELADVIRGTPGCHSEVLALGGTNYNQRYRDIGSLNPLLAKGHVNSILAVLAPAHHLNPPPEHAIIDQFAATEATVAREAKARGLKLKVVQRHKAEEDLAVAAASILARHEFVTRLAAMGKELGVELPKGASAAVDKVAKQIVERHGVAALARVAKMHFRTALRAQGLPEPPKVEWRRK